MVPLGASLVELEPLAESTLDRLGTPDGEHVLVSGPRGRPVAMLELWSGEAPAPRLRPGKGVCR
jgi:hypothetical protein